MPETRDEPASDEEVLVPADTVGDAGNEAAGSALPSLRERRTAARAHWEQQLAENPEAVKQAAAAAQASLQRALESTRWMENYKPFAGIETSLSKVASLASANLVSRGVLDNMLPTMKAVQNLTKGLDVGRFDTGIRAILNQHATAVGALGLDTAAYTALTKNMTSMLAGIPTTTALFADLKVDSGFTKQFDAVAKAAALGIPKFDIPAMNVGVEGLLKGLPTFDTDYFKGLYERFQPRNLRNTDIDIDAAITVMQDDGIPLCLVPDSETVELLVSAPDRRARRRILIDRSATVFDACHSIIGLCVSPGLPEQGMLLRKAIDAYKDGHPEAAQALATVVLDQLLAWALDTLLRDGWVPSREKANEVKSAKVGRTFIHEHLGHRVAFFLHPMPVVHTKTVDITDDDLFYRHATTHSPTPTQLTPANAVQAVMLATSLLGYHQDLW